MGHLYQYFAILCLWIFLPSFHLPSTAQGPDADQTLRGKIGYSDFVFNSGKAIKIRQWKYVDGEAKTIDKYRIYLMSEKLGHCFDPNRMGDKTYVFFSAELKKGEIIRKFSARNFKKYPKQQEDEKTSVGVKSENISIKILSFENDVVRGYFSCSKTSGIDLHGTFEVPVCAY